MAKEPKMVIVSNHPNFLKQMEHAQRWHNEALAEAKRMGHEVFQDCIIIKTKDEEPTVV